MLSPQWLKGSENLQDANSSSKNSQEITEMLKLPSDPPVVNEPIVTNMQVEGGLSQYFEKKCTPVSFGEHN